MVKAAQERGTSDMRVLEDAVVKAAQERGTSDMRVLEGAVVEAAQERGTSDMRDKPLAGPGGAGPIYQCRWGVTECFLIGTVVGTTASFSRFPCRAMVRLGT